MKRNYVGLALAALVALGASLSLPSCGHSQKLVSLQIVPGTFTFLEPYPTGTEQYTATGTYIHPPETRDVTSEATWTIDDGVVTMSTPGLFTPAPPPAGSPEGTPPPCGGGNISASVPEGTGGSGNIVIAYATVTVDNPAIATCPGGGTEATLSVEISPSAGGTVTSLTYGINCPSVTCFAVVPVGSTVALTATANSGFSFVDWTGPCTPNTQSSCAVTVPVGGVGVVANFEP
ncbi:MAG: hypothetical protein WBQ43_18670 [Terriglobales bacterium]